MKLQRILASIAAGAILAGGLVSSTTPAEAKAKASTHCGVTAVWTVQVTQKLTKNVSLTFRGASPSRMVTVYCLVAKRKKVAKKSYLSMAFNGHPGKYTAGKSLERLLVIPLGEVGVVQLRLFKKNGGVTKTYWTSKKQYFA